MQALGMLIHGGSCLGAAEFAHDALERNPGKLTIPSGATKVNVERIAPLTLSDSLN
jgi:hypothetical protein